MAIINKGKSFADGEQLTADKLNQVIDNATFTTSAVDNVSTQLAGGAIIVKDGGVTTAKLNNGAVTTAKIAPNVALNDATVTANGSTESRQLSDRFADTVNVKDFGAVGDGVTDDTAAIQAGIDYAVAQGGLTVNMPSGVFAVTSTLNLTNANGVRLIGQGGGFFADSNKEQQPSTVIKYTGIATSSAVIRIRSTQSSPTKANSGGIEGLGIFCNGLAGRGIYCTSINSHVFQDITIDDPQVTGLLMDCLDNKLNNGAAGGDPADNQNNHFDRVSIKSDTGTCIFLAGNEGTGSTVAANTSLNYFGQIQLNIQDNDGFVFNFADGNTLEMLRVFRPAGNTGIGLRFDADDSGQSKHARHNMCYHIQTARAGVLAKAGNGTQPSDDNCIIGFSYGNEGIDNPPVVQAGATLSYISPRVLSNVGGRLLAAQGATDTALAANVKEQLEEFGSESLRVYNGASNHIKLASDTKDWTLRIDESSGDFDILGGTGANNIGLTKPLKLSSQTVATAATAGAGSALPATPQGYIEVVINGTNRKIPFFPV